MQEAEFDPKLVEEAKRKAAGPLGQEMTKYPLLFALPAYFGQKPTPNKETKISNGTISLIDLGKGPLGITCHHVIQAYRDYKENNDDVIFMIGNLEIKPIEQLIDENDRIDLAIIDLTDKQIKEIELDKTRKTHIFKSFNWPPEKLKEGDFVLFGGYPGYFRKEKSLNEFEFASWSSGATRVDAVSEERFISPFEREYWIWNLGEKDYSDFSALWGMSGGPAFIHRNLYFEFVGIVSDYSENYDSIFFASSQTINKNGTINS